MALNKLYNQVINYFWTQSEGNSNGQPAETEQMSHISRINRLGNLLKDTNYRQIQKQQICMFYSVLIKEYVSAKSSLNFPKFLYQPPLYTPKISFIVPLYIKNQKIYCTLELVIIFSQGLQKHIPTFYIKNPDYRKYKPNKKYVKFGKYQQQNKYYESILGGLKLQMPQTSNQRWSWTQGSYFKQVNILNMVKWIHKQLLLDQFPFSSRKTEQIDSVQSQAQILHKFLTQNICSSFSNHQSRLLKSIQELEALQRVIGSQTNYLQQELIKLKEIQQMKYQQKQIRQYFPQPSNQQSQKILASVSSLEALKDTTYFLQSNFSQKKITLDQFLNFAELTFCQQFEQRVKLGKLNKYEML